METPTLRDRVIGALVGAYIGDALAMPVHWFYDVRQLQREYPGGIQGYEAPPKSFPGSIMNLSNTGGGGRGSDAGDVVGSVILHGKKKFWMRGSNYHYHYGMQPGENTLDALVARELQRSLEARGSLDVDDYRRRYIALLTTPGAHNDTYAGTCHRMFFSKWARGVDPIQCPDNDGHNVDAIDALMSLVPAVAAQAQASSTDPSVDAKSLDAAVGVTREAPAVRKYSALYGNMLLGVLRGEGLKKAAERCGAAMGLNVPAAVAASRGSDPMTACYISSAFPVLLHFAYKYGDDAELALLASANAGGENVARGFLLGALVGADVGINGLPERFVTGLADSVRIRAEAEAFADRFVS